MDFKVGDKIKFLRSGAFCTTYWSLLEKNDVKDKYLFDFNNRRYPECMNYEYTIENILEDRYLWCVNKNEDIGIIIDTTDFIKNKDYTITDVHRPCKNVYEFLELWNKQKEKHLIFYTDKLDSFSSFINGAGFSLNIINIDKNEFVLSEIGSTVQFRFDLNHLYECFTFADGSKIGILK